MTYEAHDREFDSVTRLPARERYGYFVKRVADSEELWGLRDDEGWASLADPTPAVRGVVVSCDALRAHLEHELELYE